ncbi:MAG: hypothetical protein Q4F31_09450 [Eubacteriales bacterium]|nr:hypothetical protein [Eubacteriales bacterium]
MKTWRLVAGILCLVFCIFVMFQSCAAGLYNAVEENDDAGGSAGIMVSLLMLAGGIVSIATRNNKGKGGTIALIIVFLLAALLAVSNAKVYKDLTVWAAWCGINALLAIISLFTAKNR